MRKHYAWLTTLFLVSFMIGGAVLLFLKSLVVDECTGKTMVRVLPTVLLSVYIFSILFLRWLNITLFNKDSEKYQKKQWVWLFPVLNTIAIPFALFDIFMESEYGKWFQETNLFKDFINE